jgi:hypothetical protein
MRPPSSREPGRKAPDCRLTAVELAGLKSERRQTMTDTIDDVPAAPVEQEPAGPAIDEQGVAEQLVAQAREKGI